MQRIYLDWASSNLVSPKVARAAYVAMEDIGGNPSASHEEGRRAQRAVTEARTKIARTISVKPEELVFTSGGTEANNLAIGGVLRALHQKGVPYADMHVVTSATEHASVIEAVAFAEERGVKVTYLVPAFDGIIAPESVIEALRPETTLVSLAHVNSETGVIQSIPDIVGRVRRWSEGRESAFKTIAPECVFPVFHTDAAQSPMYLESSPHVFRASLVSYDAQKLMGPKGVGILYRDFSIPLAPIMGGGTQERGIRPGTENVPGIVGAAVAFELAHGGRAQRVERVQKLRDYLIQEIRIFVPMAKLIGHPKRRIANNALFAIPGVDGDYLTILMDKEGIAVSPRSACAGSGGEYSHVVFALTNDRELAAGTIRFSLGPDTEAWELKRAVDVLKKVTSLALRTCS